MLRSIGKQSEKPVESVLKKNSEATMGRINNNNNNNNNNASEADGSAAEEAATRKTAKYSNIQAHHIFQPVAVESLGPINASGRVFLSKLGRKLAVQSGDDREISFLFQ